MTDPVNPQHYRSKSGVQLIEVIRPLPFSVANAVKYVYRHEGKGRPLEDMEKALWSLQDFLESPHFTGDHWSPADLTVVLEGVKPLTRTLVLALLQVYCDLERGDSRDTLYSVAYCQTLLRDRCEELWSKQ